MRSGSLIDDLKNVNVSLLACIWILQKEMRFTNLFQTMCLFWYIRVGFGIKDRPMLRNIKEGCMVLHICILLLLLRY